MVIKKKIRKLKRKSGRKKWEKINGKRNDERRCREREKWKKIKSGEDKKVNKN